MARQRMEGEPGRSRGPAPILIGLAIVVAVAFVFYRTGFIGSREVPAEDLSRVLLVAASPDESGASVAQIIAIVDLTQSPASLEPVSPALPVTIPGTSYSALGDAYPFGGGQGTAVALADARGEDPLPYVAITPERLAESVSGAGGVALDLPVAMNVFDGEDLYTFKAGEQTLSSRELEAVLKGAPYLTDSQRESLDVALADMLVQLLRSDETLSAAETDLGAEAIARLDAALKAIAED